MANAVSIRKASKADIQAIASVHHCSWQAEFSEILPSDVVEKMSLEFCVAFWRDYFKKDDPNKETYVALVDNQIAGFIALLKDHDFGYSADCEIDKIYVSPNYQGLGIGSQLVSYGLRCLRETDYKKALVKVFIKNTKAESFYKKLGAIFVQKTDIVDYHSMITVNVYTYSL